MTIASSSGLSDKDIERMVEEAEQYAETDKERKQLIEEANKADSVCADTEKGEHLRLCRPHGHRANVIYLSDQRVQGADRCRREGEGREARH